MLFLVDLVEFFLLNLCFVVLNIVFVDLLVGVGYLYFNILVDYNYLDDEFIGKVFSICYG